MSAANNSDNVWQRSASWRGWAFLGLALALSLSLVVLLFMASLPIAWPFPISLEFVLAAFLFVAILIFACALVYDIFLPISRVRTWLLKIHAGELSARLPAANIKGIFPQIEGDLNTMVEMFDTQTNRVGEQLRRHEAQIAEKTRFLAALYSFASCLNTFRGLDELLRSMLRTLEDVLGIDRVIIRKSFGSKQMIKLASKGVFHKDENCLIAPLDSPWLRSDRDSSRLVLPMNVHGELIGMCSLYLDDDLFARRKELAELFDSVARHFGMAIEACRLNEENNRLSSVEVRSSVGREVHDSLVQTVSGMMIQASALRRYVEDEDYEIAAAEIDSLVSMIRTAEQEVRDLIERFRGHLRKTSDLASALNNLVKHFQDENTDINFFFHAERDKERMPIEYNAEVQMIVQEALTNVIKHASAKNVRVFLGRLRENHCVVLVEDDGVGMSDDVAADDDVVRHYGMIVMGERAQAIHGKLEVGGGLGEGVCVRLEYPLPETNVVAGEGFFPDNATLH